MIEIIPAIDVIGGKCVRLSQGDFNRKKTYGNPLEMAKKFEGHGIRRLHLVDLDGAREKRMVNLGVLEEIASKTGLVIDVGGGLRRDEDVKKAFESGAAMVTGGSIAVRERETFLRWVREFGPGRVILGADFRRGRIALSGWTEGTSLKVEQFIEGYRKDGITRVICTDIEKDGMLEGPSLEFFRGLRQRFGSISLIASGGIGSVEDILSLEKEGLDGVILGKSIYEGRILLKDLETLIGRRN